MNNEIIFTEKYTSVLTLRINRWIKRNPAIIIRKIIFKTLNSGELFEASIYYKKIE